MLNSGRSCPKSSADFVPYTKSCRAVTKRVSQNKEKPVRPFCVGMGLSGFWATRLGGGILQQVDQRVTVNGRQRLEHGTALAF